MWDPSLRCGMYTLLTFSSIASFANIDDKRGTTFGHKMLSNCPKLNLFSDMFRQRSQCHQKQRIELPDQTDDDDGLTFDPKARIKWSCSQKWISVGSKQSYTLQFAV